MRILLAILAVLWTSAAVAEPRTGSLIDRTPKEVTTNYATSVSTDARAVADRFGACVADYDKPLTAKVLAQPLLSEEQSKSFKKMSTATDECFLVAGGELRMSPLTVFGRMAEHDFKTRHKSDDPAALVAAAASLTPRTAMEDLALCLVRANPAGASRFIATEISSVEEKAAFKALIPDLAPCAPAGEAFTFNISATRDIYAVGLYMVANRPQQLSEAGK